MIVLAFALLQQAQNDASHASFQYTGIPVFSGVPDSSFQLRGHSANLELTDKDLRVSTVTEIKNLTNKPITLTVTIPSRREGDEESGYPHFGMNLLFGSSVGSGSDIATKWSANGKRKQPRDGKAVHYSMDMEATITLGANATGAFQTRATIPLGRAGFDWKMRATGYLLSGNHPIDQVSISYRTHSGVVFRLPQVRPDLGWQIGASGAHTRQTNFVPGNRISWISFYPGGFGN